MSKTEDLQRQLEVAERNLYIAGCADDGCSADWRRYRREVEKLRAQLGEVKAVKTFHVTWKELWAPVGYLRSGCLVIRTASEERAREMALRHFQRVRPGAQIVSVCEVATEAAK